MAIAAVIFYVLIYGACLARLSSTPGFEAGESLAVLLIFGLGFSLAAGLATRGIEPADTPSTRVRAPGRETAKLVVYLAVFAFAVLGWGFSALRAAVAGDRLHEVANLAVKLLTMVVLPALLMASAGYRPRDLLALRRFDRRHWRAFAVMAALMLALQLTIGRGPKAIAALEQPAWAIALCAPLALVWMTLEAGLTEEFLFRALLQTRASAWLRSETAGVIFMSLLFGLAHAPGYVLRGQHLMEGMATAPDPWTAAAYSIVVVSPIGFVFGVLWARTRSLLLVVLLHGWADLVPNLAPFVRTWLGGS
jgi:membrane protease YdiL (CAAX protease family)